MNNLKCKLLKALLGVSLGALGAFAVTFVVYFWNLDMKLTSVMEGILLPVMYDVPNDPTIIRVTIDKDTVEGGEAHLEYGAVRKRYKNQTSLS